MDSLVNFFEISLVKITAFESFSLLQKNNNDFGIFLSQFQVLAHIFNKEISHTYIFKICFRVFYNFIFSIS